MGWGPFPPAPSLVGVPLSLPPAPSLSPPYVLGTKHASAVAVSQPQPAPRANHDLNGVVSCPPTGWKRSGPHRPWGTIGTGPGAAQRGTLCADAFRLVADPGPQRPGGRTWCSTRPNNSQPNRGAAPRLSPSPPDPAGRGAAQPGDDRPGPGGRGARSSWSNVGGRGSLCRQGFRAALWPPSVRPWAGGNQSPRGHGSCRGGGRASAWPVSDPGGCAGPNLGSQRAGAAAGSVTRHATERR